MSVTLFIDFTRQTFFFTGGCRDFQFMFSCFVIESKWWIQFSLSIITRPIKSGLSSVIFSHSWRISTWQSRCSRVRKCGIQQAATLRIFNFSHRIIWIDNFEISRAWVSFLLHFIGSKYTFLIMGYVFRGPPCTKLTGLKIIMYKVIFVIGIQNVSTNSAYVNISVKFP